jgi:hypothetical protein
MPQGLKRLQLWNRLLFANWRWAMTSILWLLAAIQIIRQELPEEMQKQWYAASFLPHWTIHTWLTLALAVSLLVTLEAAYREIKSRELRAIPIARTDASRAWLYTPLTEVYDRHFKEQDVVLDGFFFINCTFGKGVALVYNGTAPFKTLNTQPTKEFVWKFKTDNVSIQHLLKFLADVKQIGGGFDHPAPPLERKF